MRALEKLRNAIFGEETEHKDSDTSILKLGYILGKVSSIVAAKELQKYMTHHVDTDGNLVFTIDIMKRPEKLSNVECIALYKYMLKCEYIKR